MKPEVPSPFVGRKDAAHDKYGIDTCNNVGAVLRTNAARGLESLGAEDGGDGSELRRNGGRHRAARRTRERLGCLASILFGMDIAILRIRRGNFLLASDFDHDVVCPDAGRRVVIKIVAAKEPPL